MEMIVLQGVSEAKKRSRFCWLLFCPTKSPYLDTFVFRCFTIYGVASWMSHVELICLKQKLVYMAN